MNTHRYLVCDTDNDYRTDNLYAVSYGVIRILLAIDEAEEYIEYHKISGISHLAEHYTLERREKQNKLNQMIMDLVQRLYVEKDGAGENICE